MKPSGEAPRHAHIGAEFVENVRRNMVSGTVGAVDEDAHAFEVDRIVDRRLAEFDVAAACVVKTLGLAERSRVHALETAIDFRLNFQFKRIGKLLPTRGEELDAVVVVRVVAR